MYGYVGRPVHMSCQVVPSFGAKPAVLASTVPVTGTVIPFYNVPIDHSQLSVFSVVGTRYRIMSTLLAVGTD
jgi:hypothetical protein